MDRKVVLVVMVLVTALGGLLTLWSITSTAQELGVQVGAKAVEIDVELVDETRFVLSKQWGKVVILDFMTTWCVPCERQLEVLRQLREENAEVVIVSIDVDPSMSLRQLEDWALSKDVPWPVGHSTDAGRIYQVSGVPTVIVVDGDGVLRFRGYFTPLTELRSVVEGLQ